MDTAAVFIDGFNLYHGMLDADMREWLWIDLWALSERLTPSGLHLAADERERSRHRCLEHSHQRTSAQQDQRRRDHRRGLSHTLHAHSADRLRG